MRNYLVFAVSLAALCGVNAYGIAPARAADCSQGTDQEKIACLSAAVSQLSTKLEALTTELADTIKWNDRVALRNEDMRIFPRCLDNPGPNSHNITDIFANSCAKVSGQAWMIAKAYR